VLVEVITHDGEVYLTGFLVLPGIAGKIMVTAQNACPVRAGEPIPWSLLRPFGRVSAVDVHDFHVYRVTFLISLADICQNFCSGSPKVGFRAIGATAASLKR